MDRAQYRQLIRSPGASKQEIEKIITHILDDETTIGFIEASWSSKKVWVFATNRRLLIFERSALAQVKNPESPVSEIKFADIHRFHVQSKLTTTQLEFRDAEDKSILQLEKIPQSAAKKFSEWMKTDLGIPEYGLPKENKAVTEAKPKLHHKLIAQYKSWPKWGRVTFWVAIVLISLANIPSKPANNQNVTTTSSPTETESVETIKDPDDCLSRLSSQDSEDRVRPSKAGTFTLAK